MMVPSTGSQRVPWRGVPKWIQCFLYDAVGGQNVPRRAEALIEFGNMQNSQFTGNDNVDAIEAQGMQAVLQLAARLGGSSIAGKVRREPGGRLNNNILFAYSGITRVCKQYIYILALASIYSSRVYIL